MTDNTFLKVAKQAAVEAGLLIYKYFGRRNKVQNKNNDASNLVTEVDLKSEKLIVSLINKHFPNHNIITEEADNKNRNSEYTWAIDPLDGTISFVHGMPHFSVAVGLMRNNQPIVGAIYNVINKDLYYGQVGKGAYLNGKKIRVSKIKKLEEAAVVLGFGTMKRRLEKFERYAKHIINKVGFPYAIGSAATGHVFLSKGLIEATFDIGWIWDFVAGTVIIRESGGRVTDLEGKEPDWTKERFDILTSNGLLHDQILEVLKQ